MKANRQQSAACFMVTCARCELWEILVEKVAWIDVRVSEHLVPSHAARIAASAPIMKELDASSSKGKSVVGKRFVGYRSKSAECNSMMCDGVGERECTDVLTKTQR